MSKTRRALQSPLFGDISDLKVNTLPTYEEVMKCYEWTRYHLKSQMKNPKEPCFPEIAELVSKKIETIWQTASLPTVSHTRVIQILKAYYLKCKNKLKSIKRLTNKQLESFRHESKVLFDISSCKCKDFSLCVCLKETKVPKKEQSFLLDQRTCRKMMIGNVDISSTKKLQNTLMRKRKMEYRESLYSETDQPQPSVSFERSGSTSSSPSSNVSDEVNISLLVAKRKMLDKPQTKHKIRNYPTLSKTCDRYGISDRAAAAIASSVLHDIQADLPVIDRHKVRRERNKTRQQLTNQDNVCAISALYFDGRKDKTLKIVKKGSRDYRETVVEEHISLVQEPDSIYMGYVVPHKGSAKEIENSIIGHFLQEGLSQQTLIAVGCDGTNVNTGKNNGVIRLLEERLQKPLQWIICLLHMNELPLRHLFVHLDGRTTGPKSYTGVIGVALEHCENLPLKKFRPIKGELPNITTIKDLSSDQWYLYRIVSSVMTGVVSDDLVHKSPGKLSHARWLTRANRKLRLYISTESPTTELITLATFVVKVYAPTWFSIKTQPSCKDGARHLFKLISSSRYLPQNLKNVIDPVIARNCYFAHPENLLLAMITDEQKHVRELGARRILKARKMPQLSTPRVFEVPQLNLTAASYIDLINWQQKITEPPLLNHVSDEEMKAFIQSSAEGQLLFLRLPSHTQAVERSVKITTEASSQLCTKKARIGLIKAKLESRKIMPKFETKRDFKSK